MTVLISAVMAGLFMWLTKCLADAFIKSKRGYLDFDLKQLLEKTAASDNYMIFLIQTVVCTAQFCLFHHVSNHIIMSLDIIFLFSLLILVMYQVIKDLMRPASAF